MSADDEEHSESELYYVTKDITGRFIWQLHSRAGGVIGEIQRRN
jgi:hypothetical protein